MFFPLSALSVLPRDSCHLLIGRCTFRSLPLSPATQLEILLEFNRISKVLRKFRCFGEMQFSFLRFLLLCQLLPLVLFFFSFFFFFVFLGLHSFFEGIVRAKYNKFFAHLATKLDALWVAKYQTMAQLCFLLIRMIGAIARLNNNVEQSLHQWVSFPIGSASLGFVSSLQLDFISDHLNQSTFRSH